MQQTSAPANYGFETLSRAETRSAAEMKISAQATRTPLCAPFTAAYLGVGLAEKFAIQTPAGLTRERSEQVSVPGLDVSRLRSTVATA